MSAKVRTSRTPNSNAFISNLLNIYFIFILLYKLIIISTINSYLLFILKDLTTIAQQANWNSAE
jgi:hypothetical protein